MVWCQKALVLENCGKIAFWTADDHGRISFQHKIDIQRTLSEQQTRSDYLKIVQLSKNSKVKREYKVAILPELVKSCVLWE
jgi:hypothetical protein